MVARNKTNPSGNKQSDQQKVAVKENILESNKYVYEQINGWIENADNKVNTSCAIFTGVFGVITFLAQTYEKSNPDGTQINECLRSLYKISLVASLVVLGIALFFYVKAIFPNLDSGGNKSEKKYFPIFYGDISALSADEYKQLMNTATSKQFRDELVNETHQNAKICMEKMQSYKLGLKWSLFAIVLSAVSFLAHYFMYG